ncbi:MAG: hypothetical protein ACREMA_00700 [Longimicrobiales bacterium]
MKIITLSAALLSVSIALGCSSATTANGAPRADRNRLTQEQLATANSDNLYEAIVKLRPEWLNTRGPTSVTDPTPTSVSVFMNGNLMGRAESLRDLRILDVTEVRYWAAGQAAAKFGMGHPRGVIELTR